MDFLSSEHIIYENNGHDKLVIFFSDLGNKKFAGFKMVQPFQVDKLFVRDLSRSWYNGPIEGLSSDIFDLVNKIKELTASYLPENIYCIGLSMGGYAAAVIGCLIGARNALAFSPQMMIDPKLPKNPPESIRLDVKNAYEIIAQYPSTKITIVSGSDDMGDVYNALPAYLYENTTFICLNGSEHNTLGFIKRSGYLQELLAHFLITGSLDGFPLPTFPIEYKEDLFELIGSALDKYYSHLIHPALEDFTRLSKEISSWSAVYFYMAECYVKLGDYESALENINKAISINPIDDIYYLTKGVIELNLKKLDEAEQTFITAKQTAIIQKPLHDIRIGSIKSIKGEYKEAREILEKVLETDDINTMAIYQLGILSFKEAKYPVATNYFAKCMKLGLDNENCIKHFCNSAVMAIKQHILNDKYQDAKKVLDNMANFKIKNPQYLDKFNELRTIIDTVNEFRVKSESI